MKFAVLLIVAVLGSSSAADTIMDFLVDGWIQHAREMIQAAHSEVYSTSGFQFYTECGAFLTNMNCTVTADVGMLSDMATLTRISPVDVSSIDNTKSSVQFTLSYNNLRMHFPNLIIQGEGINMVYKDIVTSTTEPIPFTLQMTLDYTNGVDQCSNSLSLVHPPSSSLQVSTTVRQPSAVLPQDNDLSQNAINFIIGTANQHISSLIQYENICTKLANLL